MKPKIIGICGGSASGKSTLAKALSNQLGVESTLIISLDSYYFDVVKGGKSPSDVNYDHPDSIEIDLLKKHLVNLLNRKSANIPIYDFESHTRLEKTIRVFPAQIIIVEGLFLFNIPSIHDIFSLRIFVDTPEAIRLNRRISRDVDHRGRSPQSVIQQYKKFVAPMYNRFVVPNRALADLVINGTVDFKPALSLIENSISQL